MIVIKLSEQLALDAYPKTIQQDNFTWNLDQAAVMFLIIEKAIETILYFLQGTVRVL